MHKLYSAADLQQAYLLSHLLRQAGIAHYISNENLQGGVGELPFTHTYPAIWLFDEADRVRARTIIEAFEQAATRQEDAWRCAACGEDSPGTFETCWKCGCGRD
ncbi:MAG: DUF2007 domain-containing protein [Gammaproteobacteria bacterium]|nr:DUF2007 domain-containing protein [Gammaproteobacteria bacterium]